MVNVTLSEKPLPIYINKITRDKYRLLQHNDSKEIKSIVLISKSKHELEKVLNLLRTRSEGEYLKINSEDGNAALRDRMGNYDHAMMSSNKNNASSYYKTGIFYYSLAGNQINKKRKDENLKSAIYYLKLAAGEGHEKASRIIMEFPDFDHILDAFKEGDYEAVQFLFQEKVISKKNSSSFHLKRISRAKSIGDRDYIYYDRIDPLLASLYSQDSLLIKYVLDQGYDINKIYTNLDNRTPLHIALKNGKHISAYYLLQFGAKTSKEDRVGFTPLSLAVAYMEMSKNSFDIYNQVSLWLIHNLVAYGASPNQRMEKSGFYILHYAAMQKLPDAAKKLLKIGADPNVVDSKDKRTPLYYAIWKGNLEMVKVLLEHGAKLDVKDNYGVSPYKYAKRRKEKEIVSLLKQYK
ncbi:MAG: ankyrin repeat domain-containing protein [Hymenobacteraceae bacterium]|nr:ankyrin repeat domain-containing protein [Hymenobacteraceae bacterium]MDX5442451.1 ankyrin repeat domain-containing protein [Hymenobacteraceae bacterium]MDX5512558.1 ankyrin repeat domain-containing protein [Hymenobacteraceae bacterium]